MEEEENAEPPKEPGAKEPRDWDSEEIKAQRLLAALQLHAVAMHQMRACLRRMLTALALGHEEQARAYTAEARRYS